MIIALMIGHGAIGYPNKNLIKIFGKHLCDILMVVKKTKMISKIFISTDCPKIKKITKKYNPILIERPKYLATNSALGEEVFRDAYYKIKKNLNGKKISLIVLLMANAGTINASLIKKGLISEKNKKYDSVVTTSVYNMWSPIRARSLKNGCLVPFVPFKFMGGTKINCDRDARRSSLRRYVCVNSKT